ncbi:type II secretion system protein [Propionivibrio dicarboxylicus]|uniref:Prepilin-type N-terminal cleavage/methylation domain-containing protein n=1 Tax=Propionivibrio dicarboxylicus TaxID=83767 RepID=A0A1G8FTU6_9RHOO|nr:prepilin-type N-terminal cleavage/methylation domain-containing protein [Propionivibrio dicarboxylicus]SDH85559.1 prepilin-type N-terminal cleavage/methylation domain-containing protein [Propionivibrio dicarboxylicus]
MRCSFACTSGFTLVELSIVLVIISLLLGSLTLSFSTLRDAAKFRETQRQLLQIRETLLGFAAANGRLPCPASPESNGLESLCTNDTGVCGATLTAPSRLPEHGRCSHPFSGFLPGATLGHTELDDHGYAVDSWGGIANRFRYAIASNSVNQVKNALTASEGMKAATMAAIANADRLLSVCSSAANSSSDACHSANQLTNAAVAVIFSAGRNAPTGGISADEAENIDDDTVFVSHSPTSTASADGEFDDLVTWLSPGLLFNRMIAAGRLP